MMQSSDNLSQLPTLSAADKVSRMQSYNGSIAGSAPGSISGSRNSLRGKVGLAISKCSHIRVECSGKNRNRVHLVF